MKLILKSAYTIILAGLLAACGVTKPVPTVVATATPVPSLTAVSSTPTVPSVTSAPTSSMPISSAPDGLRIAYVMDENLYIQNGNNPPLQLTQGDRDRSPTFSDDGKKIVFLRRFIPHDLYSINADGSQEKVLVSGNVLKALDSGYSELSEIPAFAFVPDTHLIIFNTRELDELDVKMQDWNRTGSKNKNDLLIVDTDSGEIKSLSSPGKGGNFVISPDGNTIAVQANGYIDLVGIDGRVMHRNLVTYIPTTPYELTPGIFWSADATELIVTLPVREIADMSGPETLSVWRYAIDDSVGIQVALDPPLLDSDYSISPDGNWILYNYFYYPGKTVETITSGLYLGNLRKGGSQLYAPGIAIPAWSSDSTHFVYDGLFLGTVGNPPKFIGKGGFLGWMDSSHYLYFDGLVMMGEIGGETINIPANIPATSVSYGPSLFSFIYLDNDAVSH